MNWLVAGGRGAEPAGFLVAGVRRAQAGAPLGTGRSCRDIARFTRTPRRSAAGWRFGPAWSCRWRSRKWPLELWAHAYRARSGAARATSRRWGPWATSVAEFVEPHLPGLVEASANLWFFLAGGTVLMLLGLADDVRKLDWRFRLAIELLVAAAVVFGRGWTLTLFVDWPLVTGVDQRAVDRGAGQFVQHARQHGRPVGRRGGDRGHAVGRRHAADARGRRRTSRNCSWPGFLFVLVGALVGFLFHNRPPARLFMGDAGSYFVGFCLAVMTILATFSGSGLPRHAILAPLCVLAVPLYDTLSVVWIRLRAGRSPFEGDTNHFSHRLVALGLTKAQAVLTIYLTTAACGLGALLLHQVNVAGAAIVMLVIACLLSVIAILETTALRKSRLP